MNFYLQDILVFLDGTEQVMVSPELLFLKRQITGFRTKIRQALEKMTPGAVSCFRFTGEQLRENC